MSGSHYDEKYPAPKKAKVHPWLYPAEDDEKPAKLLVDSKRYADDENNDFADSKYGAPPADVEATIARRDKEQAVYQDAKDFFQGTNSKQIFQQLVQAAASKFADKPDNTRVAIQSYLHDLQQVDFQTKFTVVAADDKRSQQEIADEQFALKLQLEELGVAFQPKRAP